MCYSSAIIPALVTYFLSQFKTLCLLHAIRCRLEPSSVISYVYKMVIRTVDYNMMQLLPIGIHKCS
jgi:hypothetical protein